jgi:SufS family cysteine desulfurase
MEHHANFVPWQQLALQTGARFVVVPLLPSGEWDWDFITSNLSEKAKVVAFNWVSNALGTVNEAQRLSHLAKSKGAYVLIDGAQAVAHFEVNVQELGCDFFVFSGHKMYGPTGMGVLWGKSKVLNTLPPYRTGGEMIQRVTKEVTTFNVLPFKYEAGTPNIEAVVGFREAVAFCNEVGRPAMHAHEVALAKYAIAELEKIEGVVIYAKEVNRVGVVSFNVKGIHASDIGTLLDQQGVAVRTGHHCTQPLWDALGELGSVRASFAVYNSREEIDVFISALKKSLSLLQ